MWPQPESFYFSLLALISLSYKSFLSPTPFCSSLNGDWQLCEVLKKKCVCITQMVFFNQFFRGRTSMLKYRKVRIHHAVLGRGHFLWRGHGEESGAGACVRCGNSTQRGPGRRALAQCVPDPQAVAQAGVGGWGVEGGGRPLSCQAAQEHRGQSTRGWASTLVHWGPWKDAK